MTKKSKIWVAVGAVLVIVLVVVANVRHWQSPVRAVRVTIDYGSADTLVAANEVESAIGLAMPELAATRLCDADLSAVAAVAARCPYLRECHASTTIDGAVAVFAKQRRPIVRVFAQGGEYYLDVEGAHMPVSKVGSSDVIVANGNIPVKGDGLAAVWRLAVYLDSHEELSPLFDQIYRDAHGDLFLTPKLGSHIVQVGDAEDLDGKFQNLMALYSRGLPQAGWDCYSQISVKYKGQVVCTKRTQE